MAEAFAKINSSSQYNIQSAGSRPSGAVTPQGNQFDGQSRV